MSPAEFVRESGVRRISLWLAIILMPTALWFTFTANGHAALHLMFSHDIDAVRQTHASAMAMPHNQDHPFAHPVVLIPAHPAPTHPELQVQLYGNETIRLYVVDPEGRRSGIDPPSALTVHQIPHSTIRRASVNGDDGARDEVITVTVEPALSTAYTLDISARRSGDFRLAVNGVSPALKTVTLIRNDHVPEGTLIAYRVRLENIKPPPLSGAPDVLRSTATAADNFVSSPKETVIEPSAPILAAVAEAITKDPCGYFYRKLKTIPHRKLVRATGRFQSVWDDSMHSGCQVVMVSKAGFPDFLALDGSYLHRLGWRENYSYAADGTNGGMHAIENASERCLFDYELPEAIDKRTGKSRPTGDETTYTIQCQHK